jgi:hypothetical protein
MYIDTCNLPCFRCCWKSCWCLDEVPPNDDDDDVYLTDYDERCHKNYTAYGPAKMKSKRKSILHTWTGKDNNKAGPIKIHLLFYGYVSHYNKTLMLHLGTFEQLYYYLFLYTHRYTLNNFTFKCFHERCPTFKYLNSMIKIVIIIFINNIHK